jgi:hypothetical protein
LTRLVPALIVSFAALSLGATASAEEPKAKAPAKPKAEPAKAKAEPAKSAAAAAAPAPAAAGPVSEAEKALRERVSAYWKNRAATNLHACYPFYESAFRNKYTADQFATDFRRLNRFAPEFLGIDAATIDASGSKATVKVKLRTRPDVLQGQELLSSSEETWVLESGVWNKAGELTFPNI